jgi:meso-butanediol dehydrogenase/(S,S)-butanediol dehydrogenase/diacetyl reductase
MRDNRLEGKSVIVTGGGQGIGEAIAVRLAAEGANICVLDLNAANAQAVAAGISSAGGNAFAMECDVVDRNQIRWGVQSTVKKYGRLDGMVNSAGVCIFNKVLDITEDDMITSFRVNTLGVLFCMQEAARQVIAQGRGGTIVNIASVAGKAGWPIWGPYCVSKWGVLSLTQSAAKEWGGHQIRVNAICPGIVLTPMAENWDRQFLERGWMQKVSQALEEGAAGAALGRLGHPEDLVGLAAFLISDESSYMTGQSLVVDGGGVLW